jgi:zinc/manganese transport system substrate-binding protein
MRPARTLLVAAVAAALTLSACSSSGSSTTTTTDGATSCPTDPVDIVVTVDQWGDIVRQLAGDCANVTTIITGADVDPHDFEPAPKDNAAFSRADLAVVNGLGYDQWAENVLDTLSPKPAVVDAAAVVGLAEGANPHVWYGPDDVQQVAGAVTAELKQLRPDAAAYFDDQAVSWDSGLRPYLDEIGSVTTLARGRTYAATEPVFDLMATTLGLVDTTPEGYRNAATNESDPSPGDINDFERSLRSGEIDVLVVNTQTEGSIPEQLRSVADKAGVPVVEVTETVPAGAASFVDWQVAQLRALSEALDR